MSSENTAVWTLTGLTVLITRPAQQQSGLTRKIERAGGRVVSFPLLDIVPIEDPHALQEARQLVQDLERFHKLVFVSTNAARFGAVLINDFWPQLPLDIEVIAIGNTTARTVAALLDCSVISPEQGSDSEALLQLQNLQDVAGKRIAIFRGQGGRELLAGGLRERGAEVHYIELYRRDSVPHTPDETAAMLRANPCDVITVHSGEALKQLVKVSGDNIDRITLLPLVVPSDRVASDAAMAGFSRVFNAAGADDFAMLSILQELSAEADNQRN